jgi:hypothetical protein
MSLLPVFNKNSPPAHTKSELGVLGVRGKLVKYVVHSSKKNLKRIFFFSHKLPKQQSTSFWSQGVKIPKIMQVLANEPKRTFVLFVKS